MGKDRVHLEMSHQLITGVIGVGHIAQRYLSSALKVSQHLPLLPENLPGCFSAQSPKDCPPPTPTPPHHSCVVIFSLVTGVGFKVDRPDLSCGS